MTAFAFDHPDDALRAWAERLSVVSSDPSPMLDPVGRVTWRDSLADRDSPAADVSAMDGFAVRLSDVQNGSASLRGECAAGSPQRTMPHDGVMKIFTGGVVPVGAEAVVKVEDADLEGDHVRFRDVAILNVGTHIRRQGENVAAGNVVVKAGTLLSPSSVATLANFGCIPAPMHSKVRVSILTTGGEVLKVGQTPQSHQLRNSNAAAIEAAMSRHAWIECLPPRHSDDDPETLTAHLEDAIARSDAVILTGGVSMGDHDYVPQCVARVGGETIFHKLPIRPGKPILGAVTAEGKMICGLPGNPVSAVVNTYRMALPMLRRIAGIKRWMPTNPTIKISNLDDQRLPLHTMRLVQLEQDGGAQIVATKGSGDLVSLGISDGFVEVPAVGFQSSRPSGAGRYRFWSW